jgi:hypothetical protein
VTRARAYWTWDATSQRAMIKIYVGDDATAATAAANALAASDDPNRPVSVLAATPIELSISCGLVVAADVVAADAIAAAQAAMSELFAPQNMAIGQRLYSSQIESALMVPGAVAVQGLQVLEPGLLRFVPLDFLALRLGLLPSELFGPLEPELFAGPVAFADPGEGSFFTLAETPSIAQVTASG